jgi:preprotein translocase subunit YajC
MTKRPRNVANDIIDAIESATGKWTKQKKSEERHPGMIRYRTSRLTKEPRTTQKDAAWEVMEEAYMAVSGSRGLPALARQIYYQARPKIMAMTDNKQLAYGYFSQTLLPDYIEENSVDWNVVYDARGHFEEPHTNIAIGCGTIGVHDYLRAMHSPEIKEASFRAGHIKTLGPRGNIAAVLFCEKEGFNPLFKAVDLANRWDLMIISTKGVSVTAARHLIETICGADVPLFVLHDFDVAGFMIFGTLSRDTRRYKFSTFVNPISLGLRLDDIDGLEREPAAATKTDNYQLSAQLRENGATEEEIAILLEERVELNALTSDALIEMIETKLKAHGLQKVIPSVKMLSDTYVAFHKSQKLRDAFDELEEDMRDEDDVEVPEGLESQVRTILEAHPHLRWDDAVRLTFDESKLEDIEAEKTKNKEEAGDFSESWLDDEDDEADE